MWGNKSVTANPSAKHHRNENCWPLRPDHRLEVVWTGTDIRSAKTPHEPCPSASQGARWSE
eukprot:13442545-Alexandrium_andersonii.AAC.1